MVLPLFAVATLGALGIGAGVYVAGSGVQKATSGMSGIVMFAALGVAGLYILKVAAK